MSKTEAALHRKRHYIGQTPDGALVYFTASRWQCSGFARPTRATHPQYIAVEGPFINQGTANAWKEQNVKPSKLALVELFIAEAKAAILRAEEIPGFRPVIANFNGIKVIAQASSHEEAAQFATLRGIMGGEVADVRVGTRAAFVILPEGSAKLAAAQRNMPAPPQKRN